MLKIICSTLFHKKLSLKQDNNLFDTIHIDHLSKSLFHELNKSLLTKEIEFDNVATEEKKDDDQYSIYANFVNSNLIKILNKKDIVLRSNNCNNEIEKKNIYKYENDQLNINTFYTLENAKKSEIKKDKKKCESLKNKVSNFHFIENKNQFNENNKLQDVNIINNLDWIKEDNQKKINILNKNNFKSIKDNKNLNYFTHAKINKFSIRFFKDIYKIDNLIQESDSLKFTNNKENRLNSSIEPIFFNDIKNILEWKKLINQKILLLISNKEHQAEIHLKPEYLGSVHIKIQMKNDQVILNFTSYRNEIKTFLNNSVSFLCDSLKKNGIKLKKINIHNAFFEKDIELKSNNNLFYNTILNDDKIKKMSKLNKKYIKMIKYRVVDIYV